MAKSENASADTSESLPSDPELETSTNDQQPTVAMDDDQLRDELSQATDRALRLQAEMENLRNRTNREIGEARRYAALPLMRDLLPVVDNINRALESAENAHSTEGLLEGCQLVRQQLLDVLAGHGCQVIAAASEPFDPNLHEAISQQPSDEHPRNTVVLVTQDGYQLHDRVIRPTQVIVSSGPADAED